MGTFKTHDLLMTLTRARRPGHAEMNTIDTTFECHHSPPDHPHVALQAPHHPGLPQLPALKQLLLAALA